VEHYYTVGVSFDNGTTLFTGKTYFTPVSENLDVKSIAHAPMKVVLDTEVDVYAELNSTEHVDKVQLYHCQGDACFAPIEMTELENGTYHARIGPFETEDEVKYNVTTIFRDGGRTWAPWRCWPSWPVWRWDAGGRTGRSEPP
jgi:hypothetical protein